MISVSDVTDNQVLICSIVFTARTLADFQASCNESSTPSKMPKLGQSAVADPAQIGDFESENSWINFCGLQNFSRTNARTKFIIHRKCSLKRGLISGRLVISTGVLSQHCCVEVKNQI